MLSVLVTEKALKTRFTAQMMAAVAVLADTAPDDFRRRIVARSLFVYTHEFIRWARQAKNELRRIGGQRDRVLRLEPMLAALGDRDWGPYEEIRHKIAAHRQPIGHGPLGGLEAGVVAWNDISRTSLHILAEDARGIWNELADGYEMPRLTGFPPVVDELAEEITACGYEVEPDGVAIGVGSFDATRPDAALALQGGDLGTIQRQIVDAVRSVQVICQLWQAVNGHEPFCYAVLSAAHVEACTMHDLILGQPSTTPARYRHESLRELLERTDLRSPGLPWLQHAAISLPRDSIVAVREIRDRVGAHIDDRASFSDLLTLMQSFDPAALNEVLDHLFDTISGAASADVRLRLAVMGDARLAGTSLVKGSGNHSPFNDA